MRIIRPMSLFIFIFKTQIHIWVLPLSYCVTFGKFLNFSELHFSHLKMDYANTNQAEWLLKKVRFYIYNC